MTDVERFISKAQELTTPNTNPDPNADVFSSVDDDWSQLAPGVDPSAYDPKPHPSSMIPRASSPPPLIDTSKTTLSFQPPSKSDVEDFFATPGVCGLLNLGNTCYMNAGLQCVFGVEQIAKFYLSDHVPKPMVGVTKEKGSEKDMCERMESMEGGRVDEDEEKKGGVKEDGERKEKEREVKRARKEEERPEEREELPEGSTVSTMVPEKKAQSSDKKSNTDVSFLCQGHVSSCFSFLLKKLWTGHFSAITPKNFKTVLGFLFSQFNGFRQQDCQEFLAVLLDRLHEEIHFSVNHKEAGLCNGPNNSTVITNTFQGELKSEVTCCRCGHMSTKLDPFSYLSVPIPHAHERQIEIIWSPVCRLPDKRKLVRCLVVIPKRSTVLHIKQALCNLLGSVVSTNHITLAHVKNCSIELILGDSLVSSHVKDSEFQVYGFETDTKSSGSTTSEKAKGESPADNGYVKLQDGNSDQDESSGSNLDPWTVQTSANETTPSYLADENMETETTPLIGNDDETTPLVNGLSPVADNKEEEEQQVVVMEWYSCGICLEEMVDSDLLTHVSCGALLCADCLESSKQHSMKDNGQMPCPVCQTSLVPSKGFTPLAKRETPSNVVRLMQITVLFRQEEKSGNWSLLGHPALVNLPCSDSVDHYYQSVSHLISASLLGQPWSLALTDGKGRFCSRCLYTANCRGCLLTNAMKDASLKPGDHLSVTFRHLPEDGALEAGCVEYHSSLSTRWPPLVSLQDCLELFSQKEVLGSDNPWWCPQCDSNQQAIRHLTVSRLPSILIVHLKRFLFQDSSASKVDTSVSFPLALPSSSLTTDITHKPPPLCDLVLTGCVCHFGTLNSGHYTAYSRHPVTGNWHYYNDETVTEAIPSDKDSSSAYIFLYAQQREDTQCNASEQQLPTDRGVVSFDSEDELLVMEPLLRLMKPKPAPPPPSLPPLKRASSLGNLVDSGDQQFQLMLAESLGLPGAVSVAPAVPPRRSSSNPRISVDETQGTTLSSNFKSFEA